MIASELRLLPKEELESLVIRERETLWKKRMAASVGQATKSAEVVRSRKQIARLLTLLREKA